jgi:hypothetical protein
MITWVSEGDYSVKVYGVDLQIISFEWHVARLQFTRRIRTHPDVLLFFLCVFLYCFGSCLPSFLLFPFFLIFSLFLYSLSSSDCTPCY